uniref:Secreted peptide n=1 Tax=Anguilla anguilla TaxID=7936 RepID=A0A0E9XY66_ANGAN
MCPVMFSIFSFMIRLFCSSSSFRAASLASSSSRRNWWSFSNSAFICLSVCWAFLLLCCVVVLHSCSASVNLISFSSIRLSAGLSSSFRSSAASSTGQTGWFLCFFEV